MFKNLDTNVYKFPVGVSIANVSLITEYLSCYAR